VGYVEPEILAVFAFEILPSSAKVDPWIWIIVGDLPSAYIPCYEIDTPAKALDGYLYEMERWADAVLGDQSVSDCFPIDAESNFQSASPRCGPELSLKPLPSRAPDRS
tara:strand:+ start:793 stop:1116 length:324 start_codon:yes stop_codon:yes gene_type:complete